MAEHLPSLADARVVCLIWGHNDESGPIRETTIIPIYHPETDTFGARAIDTRAAMRAIAIWAEQQSEGRP